jgi:UDP-N-acetylglucosamine/UDP-N-acetylgalactosamine diphosphorylase
MSASDLPAAIAALESAGQAHLVAHAQGLDEARRAAFLLDAAAQPWEALRQALRTRHGASPVLRQPQALTWRRQVAQGPLRPRLAGLGRGLLAGGRVATLLLAGGQGTRLGFDGPKGNVVFGPEPDRTLYRIHAERVAAVSRAAGRPVPLLVLVSRQTAEATRAAFEEAGAWGLEPGQVRFLAQAELPCLDDEGRALLDAPGELARAPDGHGGAFEALRAAGLLDELAARGVDVLTTYQVDNPLGRSLDPVMLGWMVERRLQAIGKAVRKATPDERVGVFARDVKGRQRVVEYSELPAREEEAPPAPGEPTTRPADLGSIAIHGFAVSWLRDLAADGFTLPRHRARKKVAHLDEAGSRQEPASPNAWKLERFIFDLFPLAARAEVHEVERAFEFAPVKNATGVDSLESARALVAAEVRRWHRQAGLPEPAEPSLRPLDIDGGLETR